MSDRHRTDQRIGLGKEITRRDFLGGTTLGTGIALLAAAAPLSGCASPSGKGTPAEGMPVVGPDWYGPGGLGDYAPSHGNTPDVVNTAHQLRDGHFAAPGREVADTGEEYDLVIVGGGMAGLGAALELNGRLGDRRYLLIDNHPVFGGESKRNELEVDGVRLIGPQGANGFSTPRAGVEAKFAEGDAKYYDLFKIPRDFDYAPPTNLTSPLRFGRDHYGCIYWLEKEISNGYFFHREGQDPLWVVNPLQRGFGDAPVPGEIARALMDFVANRKRPYDGPDLDRWLDGQTYRDVIEKVLGLPSAVTAHFDPIVASAAGLGCDAVSAYATYSDVLPGFTGYYPEDVIDHRHSFPGGNDGFARHFVKAIMPWAIEGDSGFESILNGRINFAELDRPERAARMRLGATVVSVTHDGPPANAERVAVVYQQAGALRRVWAKGVVMATGAWVNRYVVRDLPVSYQAAFASFVHAPFLVANVALRQWRFLDKLGITACRYSGDFGFACNLRQPMWVGDYRPPLDPDRPALLTFYVPFYFPGQAPKVQAVRGRTELLGTSFADYERRIRAQMAELFGRAGFDAGRDIAGIILNRWGHAYVAPGPGFYFGRDGQPAPRDIIRQPHGRIAFGHAELRGNQHWGPAADEGARAVAQVLERIAGD